MSSKVLSTIVIVVLVLALITGCVVTAMYFVNKSNVEPPTPVGFAVTVNNETYKADAGGLVLGKETDINISSDVSYAVTVGAVVPSADFTLTVGVEEWKWSELITFDFTSCFDITVRNTSFVIGYKDFVTVLANAFGVGADSILYGSVPTGDIFELRIRCGDDVIRLRFTFENFDRSEEPDSGDKPGGEVTGIELDHSNITF